MSNVEEMSETQFFHLAGKYRDGDHAELYDPKIMAEIEKDYPGWRKGERAPREGLPNLERIKAVLALIDSVRMVEPFTEEERRALTEQKNKAVKLVQRVFEGIKEYMRIIKRIESFKKIEGADLDQDKFYAKLEDLESQRTAKHNAMIDDIRIAGRYVFQRFAKMPEENLQKIEDDLVARGQSLLNIERISLTTGVILPDGVNLQDRKLVAAWAEQLHAELEKEEILEEAKKARKK